MEQISAALLLKGIAPPDRTEKLAQIRLTGVETDSREVRPGNLFVAICGERSDGHLYAAKAIEKGAVLVMGQRPVDQVPGLSPQQYIQVPDILDAMIALGGNYRAQYDPCLVGVTGSVGKTTTKEFIAGVLETFGSTVKTQGNQNNEIGMPNTLMRITRETRYAVVEMGMQGLGEIAKLTHAARPAVAVITCIGVSHLEQLGSRSNILKAKMEICEGLPEGGLLVINGDDDLLKSAPVRADIRRVAYGIENGECPVRACGIRQVKGGQCFTVKDTEYGETEVFIPTIGLHNIYNALAAYTLATRLQLQPAAVAAALANYKTVGHRQHLVKADGIMVMEDCYNANPDSMRAALHTLQNMAVPGRKIALLADMLELGTISEQAHREIGVLAAECGADCLLTYGKLTKATDEAARQRGIAFAKHFDTQEQIAEWLHNNLQNGDYLLLKGSHSMALEQLLPGIYEGKTVESC